MSENYVSANPAQSERYINRISSSVVVFFKLLDGVVAGVLLYFILGLLSIVIAGFSMGNMKLIELVSLVAKEYNLPGNVTEIFNEAAIGGIVISNIVWGGVMTVIMAGLVLVVLEAIGLLFLRIARKGAGLIKVIHQIYMVIWLLYLLLLGYSSADSIRTIMKLPEGDAKTAALTSAIVLLVINVIISLLNLCYHKDIAMAMTTVKYELETGRQGKLRRTHLSGISFFFCLPYLNAVLWMILGMIGTSGVILESMGLTDVKVSDVAGMGVYWITMISIPIILMGKNLGVCFCNRNLKKAHRE